MYVGSMRRYFKDSLKVLEADIQHANTLLIYELILTRIWSKLIMCFCSFDFSDCFYMG
ncbi:hypothetical protein HanHA300_Chr17g0664701 [Helianthus annuus]|nr:hypothetical protein HanHA300_Chr17g0664701 [Helianthus annuus]KAJ0637176.1 hypothetical protein HanOQP8_Chr17g0670681 [Helianthus annuus]